MTHWRKILALLAVFVAYFVLFGILFGWHRLHVDFIPLDQSVDGPNIYASFLWVPFAALAAWIVSDLRHEAHKEEVRLMHEDHLKKVDERIERHGIHMAELFGSQNEALNATPGDRSLDESKET